MITFSMPKPVSDFSRQNIYMHVISKLIYSFIFLRLLTGAMLRTWKIKRIVIDIFSCTSLVGPFSCTSMNCSHSETLKVYGPKGQNRS